MFSRSCEYALQSVLFLSIHSKNGKAVGLKQISESQSIPIHFLSKVLQQLVRHKILTSIKGPNGGFLLKVDPEELRLIRIVEIIDGLDMFDRCGIGLKKCSDKKPCPIHHDYKLVKEKIKNLLSSSTLVELSENLDKGLSIITYQ